VKFRGLKIHRADKARDLRLLDRIVVRQRAHDVEDQARPSA